MNPLITVVLFGFFFVVFNQLGPIFKVIDSEDNSNVNNLLIKAKEYSFMSNEVQVKAGETVTLFIENIGDEEHDLEIIGLEVDDVKQNSAHDHGQGSNKIHLHASPGDKQSITFMPVEQGVYRFICTLPGHEELGMSGTLEVL